jgi:cellulose synthase/poly-beta-1,6-N-acetylglucosamine synthase-like glycosyltransferase
MIAWLFLLISGLPILYLLLLSLAALLPRRLHILPGDESIRKISIIIPAHNESLLIADTVADAMRQDYPQDAFQVFVIADNCSDNTAELARQAGARVLERSTNPGKGQALNQALGMLLQEDWDAFLIVDADSHLQRNSLQEINRNLKGGGKVFQIRYGVLNPAESRQTMALELSTASFNGIRPQGKTILGLSAGILGNGFCLTREVASNVPYLAHSIVEDIEYHLMLIKAGYRVQFIDSVWVDAQMPADSQAAQVQRVRWERGRAMMIRQYAPGLIKDLFRGKSGAIDALIDVLIPPVSLIALCLVPAVLLGTSLQICLAFALGFALFSHYLISAYKYGSVPRLFQLLTYIPRYFLWKTYVVVKSLFSEKQLGWKRTERHVSENRDKAD